MMKIVNRDNYKKSFKGTILRIAVIGFLAVLIFGAMRSCVKVKAEVYDVQIGLYYWDIDVLVGDSPSFITSQYPPNGYRYSWYNSLDSSLPIVSTTDNQSYLEVRFDYQDRRDESVSPALNYYRVTCSFYNSADDFEDIFYIDYYYSNSSYVLRGYSVISSQYFAYQLLTLNVGYSSNLSGTYKYGFVEFLSFSLNSSGDTYGAGYLSGFNEGIKLTNDQAWNNGYDKGLSEGKVIGYDEATDDVFSNQDVINALALARSEGYQDGKQDGMDVNNPYTFRNLFFAVFDVPVQVFTGLFNFNLLGVNIKDFVLTLLTLSLIIVLVKRII